MYYKLDGVEGRYTLDQRDGVFLTLVKVIDGMPQKIGFKEWERSGGYSEQAMKKYKYSYGYIRCHVKYVEEVDS